MAGGNQALKMLKRCFNMLRHAEGLAQGSVFACEWSHSSLFER